MSIVIKKVRYFTKRDQFKIKEYVVVRYQDSKSEYEDEEGFVKVKREDYSCGEVHDPKSWRKAKQKLRELSKRKLQQKLAKAEEKESWYIRKEVSPGK